MKLDYSCSYEVYSLMEWLVYFIVLAIGFAQKSPNDFSHHITMIPKFWIQYDTVWSTKLDNSGSYEVLSEMEWFLYCIVVDIGFH